MTVFKVIISATASVFTRTPLLSEHIWRTLLEVMTQVSVVFLYVDFHSLNWFQGAVYIFNSIGGQWSQFSKLIASDGMTQDHFGVSVSLYGSYLLIGSDQDDDKGTYSGHLSPLNSFFVFDLCPLVGSTYLYHGENNQWTQIAKITADDGRANTQYGSFVSLYESEMVVSAFKSDDAGIDSGLGSNF
jgi:hypothetical protein